MLAVLSITFPIFALIGLGYGLTRGGVLTPGDIKVLTKYVMTVALPVLVFSAVSGGSLGAVVNPGFLVPYALGGLGMLAVGYVWFGLTTRGPKRRAMGAMGCACPNSIFVGYPIILLSLPGVADAALIVENTLIVPLALFLLERAKGQEAGAVQHPGQVILGMLRRPYMVGLILGLGVAITGLSLPGPVLQTAGIIRNSAAALSLLVIGGSLVGLNLQGDWRLAAQIVAGKLVVHPLIVAGVAVGLMALGLPLDPQMRSAAILTAAVPMFSLFAIFGQEAQHEGLTAISLLGATAASFATLNVALAILF